MNEYLKEDQLHLVHPKFRKLVEEAVKAGEKVPYTVICLSDRQLTPEEMKHIAELNKIYNFDGMDFDPN